MDVVIPVASSAVYRNRMMGITRLTFCQKTGEKLLIRFGTLLSHFNSLYYSF
jgi:hypothetical protein